MLLLINAEVMLMDDRTMIDGIVIYYMNEL